MNFPAPDKLSASLKAMQLHEPVADRLKRLILDGTHAPGYESIATSNQEAAGFYVRQHLERVWKDMLVQG